jgi:hypothetical protein
MSEGPDDATLIWGMRIGGLAATAFATWAVLRSRAPLRLEDHLRAVPPNDDRECPLCHADMSESGMGAKCVKCGIRREVLHAS